MTAEEWLREWRGCSDEHLASGLAAGTCDPSCAGQRTCVVGHADGSCGAMAEGERWPKMTETEWLTSTDPAAMLNALRGHNDQGFSVPYVGDFLPQGWTHGKSLVSDRKLRLFAVACCRQVWHLLTDERGRRAVEVAEWCADGKATEGERQAAQNEAYKACPHTRASAQGAAHDACCGFPQDGGYAIVPCEIRASLIRDIIGNPWRPVNLPKGPCLDCGKPLPDHDQHIHRAGPCPWLTPTVLSLAEAAYQERNADGTLDPIMLAVLSDALESAGCWDDAILGHLRSPGPHVRGCWAVDAILGKS